MKKQVSLKALIFLSFYLSGILGCLGVGFFWYQNENSLRMQELIKRSETSLDPVSMIAETCINARNYYILANEDFKRLFSVDKKLLYFQMEGVSESGEPFEFSYAPGLKEGAYSKYPKLHAILDTDSPDRREKKERLNDQTLQVIKAYQEKVQGYVRPQELGKADVYYASGENRLYTQTHPGGKEKNVLWAVFDASELAKVNSIVVRRVLMLGGIGMVLLLLPAWAIARLIARPLKSLVDQLHERVEALDLVHPLAVETRLTEIGRVVQSVNSLRSRLNESISHAQNAAAVVGMGSRAQEEAIDVSNRAMAEMAESIDQNASHTRQLNGIAGDVAVALAEVNSSLDRLAASMDELSEASEKTANIVRTIDGIAFQTNILALNAAVEAARAGEAGAGFAVVAEEVRGLAMRTAEAAHDTSRLIEETLEKTKKNVEFVTTTGRQFQQVNERVSESAALTDAMENLSRQQSGAVNQVNTVLEEMMASIRETAQEAEQLTATMSVFSTSSKALTE